MSGSKFICLHGVASASDNSFDPAAAAAAVAAALADAALSGGSNLTCMHEEED